MSTDTGRTWSARVNVGASHNIRNSQFPTMIAGDDDRAAIAFLGTTKGGNDQASSFDGTWHLYVAVTYDAGGSWTTVRATSHPVQIGPICMGGITGCAAARNLLDFIDVTVDRNGRILVAYADGCPSWCTKASESRSAIASIARQSGGTRLFR